MEIDAIYTPTIMDGPVVRFQFGFKRGSYNEIVSGKKRTDWSAEISASRKGVVVSGEMPTLMRFEEIQEVQRLLESAWLVHLRIKGNSHDEHTAAKAALEHYHAAMAA